MGDDAVKDRRRTPRATLGLAATVQRVVPRGGTVMAMTCDVSLGGTRLVTSDIFIVGDVVLVVITSGELTIRRQGLVVGVQQDADETAMLNIGFKTVDGDDREALRQIIDAD